MQVVWQVNVVLVQYDIITLIRVFFNGEGYLSHIDSLKALVFRVGTSSLLKWQLLLETDLLESPNKISKLIHCRLMFGVTRHQLLIEGFTSVFLWFLTHMSDKFRLRKVCVLSSDP